MGQTKRPATLESEEYKMALLIIAIVVTGSMIGHNIANRLGV